MSSSEQGKPPGFSNLQENMEKQQAKITALKDLVRQSESQQGKNTASAQEKVKNIQQRLTNLKSKATKTKYKNISTFEDYGGISNIEEEPQSLDYSLPTTSANVSSSRPRSETPGSEKITLLRKQMEENRVKMAERESQKRDIEEMVTQLKSKFESSQISLEKSAELGRSMGDLSIIQPMSFSHNRSVTDVSYQAPSSFNLEGERIKYLENRIRELETTVSNKTNLTESDQVKLLENKILDLEENVKEKDSIIQARTKAVSLLSENLTKKKKDVVDSLEETKQEMFKMQETFLETEINYKDEVDRLNSVIQNLEECNEILEKSRYDLTIENSDLKTKLEDVQDYSTKISELNKLNENLQKRISNLESQRYDFITEEELSEAKSASVDDVNTASNDNLSSKLEALEALMEQQKLEHETYKKETEEIVEKLQEKTIELNVLNANFNVLQDKYNSLAPKSLFPKSSNDEQSEAQHSKLKQQLDDSNKSAIKTKLKIKQLQKQIDAFKKTSDVNGQVAKLTEENQALSQRVVELEEEKGNYQLQLVDTENVSESELEKRIKVLEATCQNQTSAIQLLEEQKIDMSDDLSNSKKELLSIKDHSVEDGKSCDEMQQEIERLTEDKIKVQEKLNSYINENMELLDKIEKLSKGSSAESIEMVENLTQQEKMEIEQYQKSMESKKELGDDNIDTPEEDTNVEISQELNESLRNLREESSELMEKIELFTIERREVLEKLDALSIENQVLISGIENVKEEKSLLKQENNVLTANQLKIESLLVELEAEKKELNSRVEELSELRTTQQDEINRLIQNELTSASHTVLTKTISSEPESEAGDTKTATSSTVIDRESYDNLLKQLETELQNLNKNKDKHVKLKIAKKMATDAKNIHAMMTSLLDEYFNNLNESKQLREDIEKLKLHVNKQNDEELNELQKQLQESVKEVNQKNEELTALQEKLIVQDSSVKEDNNEEVVNLKTTVERLNEEMLAKEESSNKLQFLVDTLTTERDHYETEVQAQRSVVTNLREEFDQLCVDVKVNNQRLNEKSTELNQLQHEFDMRLKTSTNEVEILKTLVAEQKNLLIESYQEHEMDTAEKVKEINDYQNQLQKMTDDMERLKKTSADNQECHDNELQMEVQKLRELLKESNELLCEHKKEIVDKQETIDSLNNQIIELYKTMEENSNKLIDKEDEMQFLQEIAERNRDEIQGLEVKVTDANRAMEDLRNQLQAKHSEIVKVQHQDAGRNEAYEVRIKQAEEELKKMEVKNKEQLDKLKKYAANLKAKSAKCIELEEKLSTAASGGDIVSDEMKAQLIQYQEQLNIVKDENSKMVNTMQQSAAAAQNTLDVDALNEKISVLEHECMQLQREVNDAHEELEEERVGMQAEVKEVEASKDSLKKELEHVNEELELMKKFHAEIAAKVKEDESVQKVEDQKKMEKLKVGVVQLKKKYASKSQEMEELVVELESVRNNSKLEADQLRQQIAELTNVNTGSAEEMRSGFVQEINVLKQQLADMESSNRILNEDVHRKMSLEGQLESVEMRNVDMQERNVKLMESLATMEEEKNAIANQMALLSNEMTEKVNEFARNEYYLELQLKDLIKQDVTLEKELQVNELKCQQLLESVKESNNEKEMLAMKLKTIEMETLKLQQDSEQRIHNLDAERTQYYQELQQLQSDFKKMQADHEKAMVLKHAEIDEMEADLSSQLQRIEADKRMLQEALEKSKDQITDFQDEIIRLKDNVHSLEQSRGEIEQELSWLKLQSENYTQDQLENQELRMQLISDQTEIENLRSLNENTMSTHEFELIALRQQIADLEAMRSHVSQNQTDDQAMLQNQNIRLKEQLLEIQIELQNKTAEVQRISEFNYSNDDPFAEIIQATVASQQSAAPLPTTAAMQSVDNEQLKLAEAELEKLREQCMVSNMELGVMDNRIQDLMQENREKVKELEVLKDTLSRTSAEIQNLNQSHALKERELNELRFEMNALRDGLNSSGKSTDDDKLNTLEMQLMEKNNLIVNLQGIIQNYEAPQQQASMVVPVVAPAVVDLQVRAFDTSMFFDGDAAPSAASLFDSPFTAAPFSAVEDSFSAAMTVEQVPVVEEIILSKKAYLCYEDGTQTAETQTTNDDWEWGGNQEAQREIQELEQRENAAKNIQLLNHIQMLEEKLTDLTQMEKSQSSELERQTALMYSYEQRIRELELNVQPPTQAALVAQFFDGPSTSQFPSEQQSQSMAALEIEDGWGWGGDGAVEVQQVAQVQSTLQSGLLSPRSDLEVRLQVQQDLVKELENEKVVLGEELNSLRENAKRMMKKLKEYQLKIKESETRSFTKASSVESNDLDLAIQDELNTQVVKLEAKLKEFNVEREKEIHEKELLLKRVDVLTSASDRMTEMKERQDNQMEMYQMKIRELNQKLQSLEEWGDENVQETKAVESSPRKENHNELMKQVEALNVQLKDQQVDFDELNALLEEEKNNNKMLEERVERLQKSSESTDTVKDEEIEKLLSLLKESAIVKESLSQQVGVKDEENRELMSKIYLLSNESDNIKTILDDLSVQHREKTNENQELNERLQKMVVSNEEMRQLFNSQSIEQNFHQHANELDQQIQQLSAEIQYKDTQIMHLNGKIEELVRDDQTNSLVQGINVKDEEIQGLKMQLQAMANEKEELLKQQANVPINDDDDSVRKRMEELERCNAELNVEKQQMEHELQVLNDQVLLSIEFEDKMKDAVLDLDAKNMEIQMLKNSIEQVQQQMVSSHGTVTVDDKLIEEIERLKNDKLDLERNAKSVVDLLNAQWSQAVEQRGNEVANSWKMHLESKESEFAALEAQLRGEMNTLNVSQATEAIEKTDDDRSSAEDGEMTEKMKKIMESQELEIVSLKEQLAIRSAEYAQLASRADPYRQMPSIGANYGGQSIPANDSERVPRSELDLALYMLHQRDMRCEEMTHELINLLEERDTLQLRLSNAIRHFEEMRMKFNLPEPESTDISKTTTPEKSTNVAGSVDSADNTSVDDNLKTKLTEINNLRLSRDRGVLEEREQRFQQNMSMIQRDVINLPPEAAARIVGQSSDQGQSPSSVLLNWILGKSDSSA